ncbi:ATP-binding protein [Massilia sp. PAMC28688]|uniref:ATP-binding protein n=1 Tax=Massilia sp. PAMC28688 TaxID=2861283 RepID=UPI001C633940|nr:ATP-binding protein [Massilia sp. PAMC28688]QYF93062.1 ATP-binding protein [Massilia sp. PAMC28688]
MAVTYNRPVPFDSHPVVEQTYIVPTPSIEEMYLRVKKLIRLRIPGGIMFAHPRFGKTYGIRYVMSVLKEDFPKAVMLSFGCQMKKNHSEDAFFSTLLAAAGHPGALTGNITKKRSKLTDKIMELVDHSGLKWLVMFADEAQRLDIIEYEWLRDVHDELERRGVRMITLLIGQPSLLNQKSAFRIGGQTQIVSRFMIDEMQFRGLLTADDLATCLAGYDDAYFPAKSDWCYTRFFLPAAYSTGFRLANQAAVLWEVFMEAHENARFKHDTEIPMQYFSRTVEIALLENYQHDDYEFVLTPAMWRSAVADCNFVSAQEELRMAMLDE